VLSHWSLKPERFCLKGNQRSSRSNSTHLLEKSRVDPKQGMLIQLLKLGSFNDLCDYKHFREVRCSKGSGSLFKVSNQQGHSYFAFTSTCLGNLTSPPSRCMPTKSHSTTLCVTIQLGDFGPASRTERKTMQEKKDSQVVKLSNQK